MVPNASMSGVLGWNSYAITWNKLADEVKAYFNGSQLGSTQTALGVWVGSLSSTQTNIGALATTPTQLWAGNIAHVSIGNRALTSSEISALASVG